MADPNEGGEALAWYFRLLVKHELEKGVTREALRERMGGIGKGHLSQIESGKLGIGVPKLVDFAPAVGRTPGRLLDEAIEWWNRCGPDHRDGALAEMAKKKSKRASSESGEHPSQAPFKIAK